MDKRHYYLKLIPPRPTFPHDMTEDERRLMQEHVAYMHQSWRTTRPFAAASIVTSSTRCGWPPRAVRDETRRFADY